MSDRRVSIRVSVRTWRALYALRRTWWRILGRKGSPGWGIGEVNAPLRLPPHAAAGDLMFASVIGGPAAATYWREAGSDEAWVRVPGLIPDGIAPLDDRGKIPVTLFPTPFGPAADMLGSVPIVMSAVVPDGQILHITPPPFDFAADLAGDQPAIVIGVGPWSLEQCAEQARRTVRHGLAGILVQLGEDPGPPPWSRFGTRGVDVLELFRLSADQGALA